MHRPGCATSSVVSVAIGAGDGWWQARIPDGSGETVITRYTLRHLLNKLDELTCD